MRQRTVLFRPRAKTNEQGLSDTWEDSRQGGIARYSTCSQWVFSPTGQHVGYVWLIRLEREAARLMSSDLLSSIFASVPEQLAGTEAGPTRRVCGEHALRIEALFQEEHPRVVAYLAARTGSWAEARDVASQAFTQVLAMKDPSAVNSLKAYLYTVAQNIAKDRQKLAAIRRRIEGIARHEFTSTSPSPEPLLSAEQRVEVLQRAIEGLRPLWREVLTLRYWDHLEVNEMVVRFAQRGVDVNKRTVERWLHDAIAECRREVRAAEGDGGGK